MASPEAGFGGIPRPKEESEEIDTVSEGANDNDIGPESGPDSKLVEVNKELRPIINELAGRGEKKGADGKKVSQKEENKINQDRIAVFKRMSGGPEMVTEDPELTSFFDRIAEIENKYGPDAVKKVAALYGADRV